MRYQVITWTRGEGHDERRGDRNLGEARGPARNYRRGGACALRPIQVPGRKAAVRQGRSPFFA